MHPNDTKEYIAVDVGTVRVGLARGSSLAKISEPLTTIPAAEAVDKLLELTGKADAIVVGLPRGLDGQETAQTVYVRQWTKTAQAKIDKPFYWQDEALTTQAVKNQAAQHDVDALAAAVILQDFLDTPEDERVRCLG